MKIAFVSSGNSIHVKKIANNLVNRGYEITLFILPNQDKLLNDFDERVKIIKLPFSGKKGYYLNVPFLKRYLKKEKFDLINCHYASGCGTLTRLTGIHPVSLAVFGADVYDYPYKSKFNMKQVIKNLDNADVITSTSNVMVDKVHEYYKSDRKIYVTPFGVDLEKFYHRDVEKDDTFEFGIVKKIEYKYGIDILLKAYSKFRKDIPESKSRLVIYGRGSALEEFEKLSHDLRLEDFVEFKGFINNELVPEAFSKMDVACFPSRLDSESFGVAAVEAMACKTPVIASDASGFTEVIKNGETGIIVPKNDVDAFAEAMKKMYNMTKQEREEMGNKGSIRVKELYNFKENMEEYVEAIQQAIIKK